MSSPRCQCESSSSSPTSSGPVRQKKPWWKPSRGRWPRAQATETELDMVLLWGIAVHRSPEPARRAMAHSALTMNGVFQSIIAERLGIEASDPKAGALGAAFSGLVTYTFSRWVAEGGTGSLADMLAASFAVLSELH